ncbi:MAG TPA: hypothetical protein VF711_06135 [Acidimicrobiales bacterium]
MNTPTKLAIFGAALAVVFAASLAVGAAVGPIAGAGHRSSHHPMDTAEEAEMDGMSMDSAEGLAVSAGGYTLAPVTTTLPVGESTTFSFRILGPDGAPVTKYTPQHERDLHLIVVRRDLSGYQHLHPTLTDGTWSLPLRLGEAGVYKAFADFKPAGAPMGTTLGIDLFVSGNFQASLLPAPSSTVAVDGYTVTVVGGLTAGKESDLSFTVAKDGKAVTDLQPYLGAYGHLVALRVGDLAYLHVHPDGAPGDGQTRAGPDVVFGAQVPAPGLHRLFLDFQHGGVVRTAEFTVVASGVSS